MSKNQKCYCVYMLKCSDNSYYTGITNDMDRRLAEHQCGQKPEGYTFSRRPVELVYGELFQNVLDAIAFEKKLKGWTHAKKEALITNDWDQLKFLAQCQNNTKHNIEL
jgi:putative endonuclease